MSNKRLLVVDDDKGIRDSLKEALEFEGYDVTTAYDGKNALDILTKLSKDRLPHLILLDLMMPVMDGPLFMINIETTYKNILDMIPIFVLSARGNLALPGHKAPAGVFRKPINLDTLLDEIQKLVK